MRNRRSSIDGFVARRRGVTNNIGDLHNQKNRQETPSIFRQNNSREERPRLGEQRQPLGRSDIDESLRNIDNEDPEKKLSRRQKRRLKKLSAKPISNKRKILKRVGIVFAAIILILAGYMVFKFIIAGNNIFQGNIFDIFQSQPLKEDSNGRSNFLILGTSEDDPGHGGADLTDSMLVVSVDQKNKDIYMFSVPRDLYVEYGQACISGYSGKINAYFMCSNEEDSKEAEQERLKNTQKLVGDIFGMEIQYGVHVNHTVIKEAVDAVGGIDVDIQGSNGAPGILDRNFDWRCNYKCYLVKYDNGVHHLDGEHALFLSMARGDIAPTYGLGNSNFDREKNQQKILLALKDKATSTGTLTNVGAITGLIDSLGNNLRTNIQTSEIRTLMRVTSEVKQKDVHTLSLFSNDESKQSLVTSGPYGGASVVMPTAGVFDYTELRSFIRKSLSTDPVAKEAAAIMVLNGTNQVGLGQSNADLLIKDGFNVTEVGNAPDGSYDKVEVYQIDTDGGKTVEKLSSRFNVKIKKTSPPVEVAEGVKFVIIFGESIS